MRAISLFRIWHRRFIDLIFCSRRQCKICAVCGFDFGSVLFRICLGQIPNGSILLNKVFRLIIGECDLGIYRIHVVTPRADHTVKALYSSTRLDHHIFLRKMRIIANRATADHATAVLDLNLRQIRHVIEHI